MNTGFFDKIHLDQMDKVSLMERVDTKFWFHVDVLQEILDSISDQYYILSIDDFEESPYSTTYYDTSDNKMFSEHHNGKLNRYKVRRRCYQNSGISFLEVKFKTNKGKTKKTRISINNYNSSFSSRESKFLSKSIPFEVEGLNQVLKNEFSRITLVNKNFKERCTIDTNIKFAEGDKELSLNELVILEIKANRKLNGSYLAEILKQKHIYKSGFSKYCVGRAMLEDELKSNNFKSKIRAINKTVSNNIYN